MYCAVWVGQNATQLSDFVRIAVRLPFPPPRVSSFVRLLTRSLSEVVLGLRRNPASRRLPPLRCPRLLPLHSPSQGESGSQHRPLRTDSEDPHPRCHDERFVSPLLSRAGISDTDSFRPLDAVTSLVLQTAVIALVAYSLHAGSLSYVFVPISSPNKRYAEADFLSPMQYPGFPRVEGVHRFPLRRAQLPRAGRPRNHPVVALGIPEPSSRSRQPRSVGERTRSRRTGGRDGRSQHLRLDGGRDHAVRLDEADGEREG